MSNDTPQPFNPLDISSLAESVGRALEAQPVIRLTELRSFLGAGLYALYYRGDFPLYTPLAKLNAETLRVPIYTGKAVVDNARKGGGEIFGDATTDVLYRRILKHKSSIDAAENLAADDFFIRFLITLPVWIPLGEAAVISRYRPLWNVVMDGFGNNDPGGRRREQYRSVWDIIHPGRHWAALQATNPIAIAQITERVRIHLEGTRLLEDDT